MTNLQTRDTTASYKTKVSQTNTFLYICIPKYSKDNHHQMFIKPNNLPLIMNIRMISIISRLMMMSKLNYQNLLRKIIKNNKITNVPEFKIFDLSFSFSPPR